MNCPARASLVGLISLFLFFAAVKATSPQKPAGSSPKGVAIYDARCANCHGAINESGVAGASAQAIQKAIAGIGQMKALRGMATADVAAVAECLSHKAQASTAPATTTAPTTASAPASPGASLYHARCATCHRPLDRSDVRGASVRSIREAIGEKRQMRSLSSMTATELQAVADALARRNSDMPASDPAGHERHGRGHHEHERENDD